MNLGGREREDNGERRFSCYVCCRNGVRNTGGGVPLDRGKSPPFFAAPRGKIRHREQLFQELTVVGRSLKTCGTNSFDVVIGSPSGLCRARFRAFCGVEEVTMAILGTGRANSLDCHPCWGLMDNDQAASVC